MSIFAFVLAAAIAAQAPAAAADWQSLGTSADGHQLAYDSANLERSGTQVLVPIRITARSGFYTLSTIEIHCAENMARVLGAHNFEADGTPAAQYDTAEPLEPIPPGTLIDTISDLVCPAAPVTA